jgi:hypothetical protein
MPLSRRSALEDSDEEDQQVSERPSRKRTVDLDDDHDMDEEADPGASQVVFSSQFPELSQAINSVKPTEQTKLFGLAEEKRERAIADLSRAVLFRALGMEAIDRVKCAKEAGVDSKLSNAIYEQVQSRLQNIFGFELKRIPAFMEKMKDLPAKYENRYYLVNPLPDQQGENHKRLHSVHDDCAKEKGLLMMVLGLA